MALGADAGAGCSATIPRGGPPRSRSQGGRRGQVQPSALAGAGAEALLRRGLYGVGFPNDPRGTYARLRYLYLMAGDLRFSSCWLPRPAAALAHRPRPDRSAEEVDVLCGAGFGSTCGGLFKPRLAGQDRFKTIAPPLTTASLKIVDPVIRPPKARHFFFPLPVTRKRDRARFLSTPARAGPAFHVGRRNRPRNRTIPRGRRAPARLNEAKITSGSGLGGKPSVPCT